VPAGIGNTMLEPRRLRNERAALLIEAERDRVHHERGRGPHFTLERLVGELYLRERAGVVLVLLRLLGRVDWGNSGSERGYEE